MLIRSVIPLLHALASHRPGASESRARFGNEKSLVGNNRVRPSERPQYDRKAGCHYTSIDERHADAAC
jgi:hypothetical protein